MKRAEGLQGGSVYYVRCREAVGEVAHLRLQEAEQGASGTSAVACIDHALSVNPTPRRPDLDLPRRGLLPELEERHHHLLFADDYLCHADVGEERGFSFVSDGF